MQKLVTSSEAANILGLSLQGVHYRIKAGKLKSEKKDGKTFVYVDDIKIQNKTISKQNNSANNNYIIDLKDEQILYLKKTIKWMKKHYKQEIRRLEGNQKEIVKVFQSEISLLQSAFNEMRAIYKIDYKKDTPKSSKVNSDFNLMDIKDFFLFMKENNKSDSQIKSLLLDRIQKGDKRFIYKKETKEVIIYKSDFLDLI